MKVRGAVETYDSVWWHGGIKQDYARSGFVVRGRRARAGLASLRWQAVQARTRVIANAWKLDVSPTQRMDWEAYAAANDQRKESGRLVDMHGYNWFVKVNQTRLRRGLSVQLAAPTAAPQAAAILTSWRMFGDDVVGLTIDNSLAIVKNASARLLFFEGQPQRETWKEKKGQVKNLLTLPGIPGTGYPVEILRQSRWTGYGTLARTIRTDVQIV